MNHDTVDREMPASDPLIEEIRSVRRELSD
jgi:hypothetical protein